MLRPSSLLLAAALLLAPPRETLLAQSGSSFAGDSVRRDTLPKDTVSAPPPLVFSIGQPRRWQPYVAALGMGLGEGRDASGAVLAGVHRPFLNAVSGIFGAAGEGYLATGVGPAEFGARGLAAMRALGLAAGAEFSVARGRSGRVDAIVAFRTAGRRGGLLSHGSMLRVDYLPTRNHRVNVGVSFPVGQPLAGLTRPRATSVRLPGSDASLSGGELPATITAALDTVGQSAQWMLGYTTVYRSDEARAIAGTTFGSTVAAYRTSLARAFGMAAGDSAQGVAIGRRARVGLLETVILPYDATFGQPKDDADDIRGLTTKAQDGFRRWLRDSSGAAPAAHASLERVHARWLGVVERVHRELLRRTGDSRAVWLPLRLALDLADYDEQVEIDSLIARAVGRPFTDGNALTYLRSADLPLEIARTIYAARDYHVTWVHDFAGRREATGTVDNVGYEMVADVYLPALTAAVKRYDEAGRLPTYIISHDQYFYEPRAGSLWMSLLEDPMHHRLELPPGAENRQRERHIAERQRELREAVAASARLQRDAARMGGDWLRRTVKVHVNVTLPSDFSFRSHRIIPGLPFTPDNVMRDHRKIVLYDLSEADPFRGAMLLMGVGLGEHYASVTWEDRGYRLRGPAALEARAALTRFLRLNGFHETDIPVPLRPTASAERVELRADQGDYVGRALQVHNDASFGRKEASVVRAMLYDLAAPGSLIVVPDPLWLSREWAGMLAAAAARGARVHVIAPAEENAPSPQAPLLSLAHDVMLRLLRLRGELAPQLRESGGELRVGLFAARAPVDDPAGRRREILEGLERAPWIREVIPFDRATLAVLDRAEARTSAADSVATEIAEDETPRAPQLHQKTVLLARPGALAALARQPGWEDALAAAMAVQSRQSVRFSEQLGYETPEVEEAAVRAGDAMLRGFESAIPEAERKRTSFYFAVGTQNHDPRGMMSDAEATIVTSGFQGTAGLVDLYYLMTRSTWVTTRAELEALLPRQSKLARWLARVIRPTL
jgi:phosphatidylserine/phosphatidylglycerophosphate/cardiolipin synthase-like enzyme